MRRSVKLIIFLLLIACSFLIAIQFVGNASADTHVWVGTTSADSSVSTNWRVMPAWGNGVPSAGDLIVFNTSSAAKACTWNLNTNSFASFTMTTGYSGVITQASDLYITSFNQGVACTFTASQSYSVFDSGNFVKTAGTMTADKIILVLTGSNKYFAVNADIRPAKITVSGIYQFNSTVTFQATTGTRGLDISGTVTLLQVYLRPYNTNINYVSITGTVMALDFTNLYSTTGIHFYVTSAATYTPISLAGYIKNNLYLLDTAAATLVLPTNVHCYNLVVRGASGQIFTLDLHGYDITTDYSIGFDAVGYGRIRNLLASDNSWIHTQSFQNASGQTGQSYLYTSHLYLAVGYWQPSMLNSPSIIATNGVSYSFTPSWNETLSATVFAGPAWSSLVNGVISGTPNVLGAQSFWLNATSQNGTLILRVRWSVTVSAPIPVLWKPTFTSLPSLGQYPGAYSYTITLNETGSVWLLYAVTGLTMTNNGTTGAHILSGTLEVGNFNVKLKAQSTTGTLYQYQNYTITVIASPPVYWKPAFTSIPQIFLEAGPYSYTITLNETGNVWLLYSVMGLSITNNGTTGPHVLSGALAVGSFDVKLRAYSTAGELYQYQNFTIIVSAIPPGTWVSQLMNSPASNCTNSTSYSYAPAWNETVKGVVLSVHPGWASYLDGRVTGTPTSLGQSSFQLNYTSLNGTLTSYLYWNVNVTTPDVVYVVLVICKWSPIFTNFPIPEGNPGDIYSYVPTCNESVNYTLIIAPAWVSLANGTISGLCPAHGEYLFGLQATSVNGTESTWVFWIVHCSIFTTGGGQITSAFNDVISAFFFIMMVLVMVLTLLGVADRVTKR